jgi:general secretion pathway protein J
MGLRSNKAGRRAMTLLEILVSLGILGMISILIYGAFDGMARGKKGESLRVDRARQGRLAVDRMAREIQTAFLSAHQPQNLALLTRNTAFVGQSAREFDRLDFSAFAHLRIERDAKESDQCEIGFFVVKDPAVTGKMDLVRREQSPIDLEPLKGGVVNVLAENVESLDIRYLDAMTGQWVETWDTMQVTGQPGRLPLEVRISLTMKEVKNDPAYVYTTKVMIPIREPLSFGISK